MRGILIFPFVFYKISTTGNFVILVSCSGNYVQSNCSASQRSASMAAIHPVPAAVTACR